MEIYCVGGAVRDSLLGLPVSDHDYVVVGASPEQMLEQGFLPVGKDFPVFLHPHSKDEYALARTERKTAAGYHGFVFHTAADVTLEQDLARRDLTINAIARDAQGRLHDPFHGRRDLELRILRHVSPAFAEDPVRILRLARFCARYVDFTVAAETMELMRQMVAKGEVDALVAERVWQELARGLQEKQPARMFQILRETGALARICAPLAQAWEDEAAYTACMQLLNLSAGLDLNLAQRFALLLRGLPLAGLEALCQALKVPAECRDLALMCVREQAVLASFATLDAGQILDVLQRCDAWRKPQRFADLLRVASQNLQEGAQALAWQQALQAAQSVNPGAIAQQVQSAHPAAGQSDNPAHLIAEKIRQARMQAIHAHCRNSV